MSFAQLPHPILERRKDRLSKKRMVYFA